ncbi:hypothetical protein OsJ_19000 [Oryza sativa Japonica Group]|uniref:Uncharacterized protein n=1 Tax=Oryza sativa subsp. japonica TaxID=39947 RepID=B9FKV1_ORYSJ|nr:hypothetical protein OsJ_19000 [Oryza sativa Japonica Group]
MAGDLARGVGDDDTGAVLPAGSETRRSIFSWDDKSLKTLQEWTTNTPLCNSQRKEMFYSSALYLCLLVAL